MSKHATSRARRGRPHGPPGAARAADQPFTLPGDGAESLGLRAQRLSHILFEELYRLFRLEVNDPRLADVVPSAVEVSPDLRSARILYSLRNPPEQSEAYKTARTPGMARALVNEAVRAMRFHPNSSKADVADEDRERALVRRGIHETSEARGCHRAEVDQRAR